MKHCCQSDCINHVDQCYLQIREDKPVRIACTAQHGAELLN
jgi:hypothetical protein